jgi:hypothetical protein
MAPAGDSALADLGCPKCGVLMEQIAGDPEGPPLQDLQLCPGCYLVTWRDSQGLHLRQGIPVKKGDAAISDVPWISGEPRKC